MELSEQQDQAVARVQEWHQKGSQSSGDGADPPVFRLFGYAGTGKTTIARHIVETLGLQNVRYAAFTGKAAHVLRTKGCADASTIHSLIYAPRKQAQDRLRHLEEQQKQELGAAEPNQHYLERLTAAIAKEQERLMQPSWILREPEESDLTGSDLLVVDEVSMVGGTMAQDLFSFGVPILVIGDPAQLPPVDGGGYFIDATPDSLLTEVHRSALDSPVTRLATTVRRAESDQRYGVRGMDGDSGRVTDLSVPQLLEFDQVLCGTNATRWEAIQMIREMSGLQGSNPYVPNLGDRIVVLANNYRAEVFNGQQFTVTGVAAGVGTHDLEVTDDAGASRELAVAATGFHGPEGERRARLQAGGSDLVAATFGQAITVHKAQGSQWGSVLVIDESHVFYRMARGSHRTRYLAGQRWTYTAVTRAQDRVVLTGAGAVR